MNLLLRFDPPEAPVVLRIYTRDPLACQKEVTLLRAVSLQLPVPEIIYANEKGEEDIGPHVLYRYAEGMTFQELKSKGNPADMAEAAFAIGKALALLQTVSVPPPFSPAIGFRHAATDECLSTPVLEQRIGALERDRLRGFVSDWLPRIRHLYEERALVHGDFNNRNTVVKREGDRWVISGILDWELAFSGSPLWDAARFICYERKARPCREPHFSMGFREGGGKLPKEWSVFSRVLNTVSATESLSRPDLPEHFVPELRDLITATMDDRDPA